MKEKQGGGAFAVLQQLGKSLFLAIAILPFAGVLLGIGNSFTNSTTIATYGLTGILHPGTILYSILLLINNAGNAIFGNLALIFALAVALGMAKKEKGVAVLSAGIFYIIMHTTINSLLVLDGSIVDGVIAETVKDGAITSVLGIQTLQVGVFGGIVAGLCAAALCNRFYKMQLPSALSFFAGTRFVPIVSMLGAVAVGAIFYFVWPTIQNGIFLLGDVVMKSGYFGTFLFGVIERALIPFGLHHVFYLPIWQTGISGSAVIDGVTVYGAQNIFFAELASPNTTHFSVSATRFLTGKYPFMMAGLPGAAFAMYTCARPEKKKEAGSLLFSVALTSFLTGITEPIEFTFLFLAPALFVIHVIFAGLAFAACHVLNICIGTTFSDGLIDFVLYGVLPGQGKSNWLMMLPVFAVYFVLYFVVFRYFILKWNLKTPGREDDGEKAHLYSKAEYQKATGVGVAGGAQSVPADFDARSAAILRGVGGVDNLTEIDCCATRLRLTLNDASKVDEALLKTTGASGVVVKGSGIQIIYGPQVTLIKSDFEDFVENVHYGKIPAELLNGTPSAPVAPAAPQTAAPALADETYVAHAAGEIRLMNQVEDEVFAGLILGDGIAVEPAEGKIYAPIDGKISNVADTKHAIGITTPGGAELLIHVGIDTVALQGQHFNVQVTEGQKVKKGDLLLTFDMDAIKAAGYKCTTPLIVTNTDDYKAVRPLATGRVKPGETILEVKG
ncbi:MAG: glucose PTS transporter subunit IIA [Oscillospiraceae bacterium]|nr:glucose PTS transporter subunit IIA [Oscillospiraceae bacterium]